MVLQKPDCYKFFGKIGHIYNIKPRITAIGNKTKPSKDVGNLRQRQVEKVSVLKKEAKNWVLPYETIRNKDKR